MGNYVKKKVYFFLVKGINLISVFVFCNVFQVQRNQKDSGVNKQTSRLNRPDLSGKQRALTSSTADRLVIGILLKIISDKA